ncbi:hypothetical protein [Pelagicoccus enzymogenes]|uniref:hypothetical protein n=1 Tax=Pelagicoccus enzymogenes TaxID=2773457 RepID=UPI0021E51D65|nr:hypothetical protein [Pelagicoccus enzymogenes]MDQ8197567.1 hypothetical protein [Pelagicoccus enzymogenes]
MLQELFFRKYEEGVDDAADPEKKNPKEYVYQKVLPGPLFKEDGEGRDEDGEDYVEDTHSEQVDRWALGEGQGL